MRKPQPPSCVKGAQEFVCWLKPLDKESYLFKIVDKGLNTLKRDMLAGNKIEKKKWPKMYIKKYGITNLFRLDLNKNYRFTYTIIAEGMKKVVCVIEAMDHNTYNRRFGYHK